MKKLLMSSLALVFFQLSSVSHAKDEAFAVRATEVKDQPFSDAKTTSKLSENVKIEVLARKGSWMQVSAPGINGWVKMLSLRFESRGPATSSDNSALKSVWTARSGVRRFL